MSGGNGIGGPGRPNQGITQTSTTMSTDQSVSKDGTRSVQVSSQIPRKSGEADYKSLPDRKVDIAGNDIPPDRSIGLPSIEAKFKEQLKALSVLDAKLALLDHIPTLQEQLQDYTQITELPFEIVYVKNGNPIHVIPPASDPAPDSQEAIDLRQKLLSKLNVIEEANGADQRETLRNELVEAHKNLQDLSSDFELLGEESPAIKLLRVEIIIDEKQFSLPPAATSALTERKPTAHTYPSELDESFLFSSKRPMSKSTKRPLGDSQRDNLPPPPLAPSLEGLQKAHPKHSPAKKLKKPPQQNPANGHFQAQQFNADLQSIITARGNLRKVHSDEESYHSESPLDSTQETDADQQSRSDASSIAFEFNEQTVPKRVDSRSLSETSDFDEQEPSLPEYETYLTASSNPPLSDQEAVRFDNSGSDLYLHPDDDETGPLASEIIGASASPTVAETPLATAPNSDHSRIFLATDEYSKNGNIASVNSGATDLHIGGGGINRAFGRVVRNKEKLEALHKTCLKEFRAYPREMVVIGPERLMGTDLAIVYGMTPSKEPDLEGQGTVMVQVFKENFPEKNPQNRAMIYVVPPNGKTTFKGNKKDFLEIVKITAKSIVATQDKYNRWAATENNPEELPQITVLRACAISSDRYCPKKWQSDAKRAVKEGIQEYFREAEEEGRPCTIKEVQYPPELQNI